MFVDEEDAASARILAYFELCKVHYSTSVTSTHQHTKWAAHKGPGTMTHSTLAEHVP